MARNVRMNCSTPSCLLCIALHSAVASTTAIDAPITCSVAGGLTHSCRRCMRSSSASSSRSRATVSASSIACTMRVATRCARTLLMVKSEAVQRGSVALTDVVKTRPFPLVQIKICAPEKCDDENRVRSLVFIVFIIIKHAYRSPRSYRFC